MATYNPRMLPTTRQAPSNLGLIGLPGQPNNLNIPGVGPSAAPAPPPGTPAVPGGPAVGASGALPTELLGQTAGNLSGALRGELPADVLNLLQQQAAEYGVGGGTSGSQFAGYAGLRNLGLTSLDRMKHAENLLAGQFLTPSQQAQLSESRAGRESSERLNRMQLQQQQEQFQQQLAQKKLEFAQQQAAAENALKFNQQMAELQALNGKYGGLPGYGGSTGRPVNTRFYGGESGPGPLNRLF